MGGRAGVRAGADQTDNALAGACDPLGRPIGHVRTCDVAFDGSAASDYERRNRVRTLDVTERNRIAPCQSRPNASP